MISTTDRQTEPHTIWGLDPTELHDRFWAARGVQVVRQREPTENASDAELFLMTDASALTIFRIGQLVDTLNWLGPRILFIRLRKDREHGYREQIISDEGGRFVRLERVYGGSDARLTRMALTPSPDLAKLWQNTTGSAASAWRHLRQSVGHTGRTGRTGRTTVSVDGSIYNRTLDREVVQYIRKLVQAWTRPDVTIRRARPLNRIVWADMDTPTSPSTRFIGPVWVGAGRHLDGVECVVGPTVLWDDPKARPAVDLLQWLEIDPTNGRSDRSIRLRRRSRIQRAEKRLVDIICALAALGFTVPVYPLVMLSIWLEDGAPFFFAHRRETMGGREFPCLKFRTMRKDAEKLKARLAEHNQADGPQFFLENDPRLTRVGRFIRRFNIDELPQFFNVLVGHMSLVGPRPSPHSENQYCPPWREARLSARPGITGLWQVIRSRQKGLDFQEWIRYDIEYVENPSWQKDLWIIWRTFGLLGRRSKS